MKKAIERIVTVAVAFLLLIVFALVPGMDVNGLTGAQGADPTTTPAPTTPAPTTPAPTTPRPTATPVPTQVPSQAGVSYVHVLYKTEEILIGSDKQVYYAPLKKATDTTAKPADMIMASKVSDGVYLIDISNLSSSKTNFIGITNKLSADSNGLYPVMNYEIPANQKKITFNLNWGAEGATATGIKLIKNVIINNNDSTTVTYEHTATATDTVRPITELKIQWRKGANCDWSDIGTLSTAKWESMKTSGAILYLRLAAVDGSDTEAGCRYSKENKIKIAVTKATAVKLDVNKLNLTIKNGMQLRMTGKDTWSTILPFSNKSTMTSAVRNATLSAVPFDPYSESTSEKVSYLMVDEVYKILSYTPPTTGGTSIEIDTRIAATTKKPASRASTMKIPYQYEAPVVKAAGTSTEINIISITNAPTDKVSGNYEFFVADKTDISSEKIEFAEVKWSAIKTGTVLKKSAVKTIYKKTDGSRRTVNLSDANAVVLVRRKGIAASKKNSAVLASQYAIIDPSTLSSTTPTVTPAPEGTATPTPEGTTTPTPEPATP